MQRHASTLNWLTRTCCAAIAAVAIGIVGLHVNSRAANSNGSAPPHAIAIVVTIQNAIGPATSDFFTRALKRANQQHNALLIVELDTPGGLDAAMRDMIQALLASAVPVVIYVSPSGARAASAGTYLLYASHIAAMAPATNLGAATPISIMPRPEAPKPDDKTQNDSKKDAAPVPEDTLERKAINDAAAYIRGLAELRGRNGEWAESAVRSAASLSAAQALDQHVIDIVATDIGDLLRQLDGRGVTTATGAITLHTQSLVLERVPLDWRTNILATLTNPNVAYLLMLIGIYGLLLEGYHPGAILPGVVGAISLLLALFAFQILSVNYAGLALIALGVLLIVVEALVPAFGTLGIGGIASFVLGSIMLMDSNVPGLRIAWQLIGSIALVAASLLLAMVLFLVKVRRRPAVTGIVQLLDEPAYALDDFEHQGMVRVRGELWQAISARAVHAGERLRVVRISGLKLEVEPCGADTDARHAKQR